MGSVFWTTIVDPNGNVTDLIYETLGDSDPRLVAVRDPGGRQLSFSYENRAFRLWKGDVITKITGPEDLVLNYEYDIYGNLIKASREPHEPEIPSRSEQYEYERDITAPIEDRSLLSSTTDLVSGAITSYRFIKGSIGLQGDVLIPVSHISQVEKPEGGIYSFEFDPLLISSGSQEFTTRVFDPRDKETVYTLNRYGSPVSILDPNENETTMFWHPDDVLMTSRTDANGGNHYLRVRHPR